MVPTQVVRRAAALWLMLLAAYAATLGLDAFGESDYGGDEPHYLLGAQSIVEDGDLDVKNQYAGRDYSRFYPYALGVHGRETEGRLHEPHGAGFPLLIAPAYALGGAKAVELFLAAVAALAIALAYVLALRVVPDPWALGAALAVGLSPPFLAYGTAVYPELTAGAALAGSALLALRLDDRISRRQAFVCFALLGSLPWLGTKFVPAGIVIAVFAARSLLRGRRRTLALGSVELAAFSVAFSVAINEALYGGPTPYAAGVPGETATDAASPRDYLERAYRLAALLIDREYGLLRWAPVFLLALGGLWLLWRSRRERLSRALPELRAAERTALLCAAALGAQLLVAAFLAPTMFGFWFPPRHLLAALALAVPLAAWGLRHAPRVGACLSGISVAASLWLYLDVRLSDGGLVTPRPESPFGPLTAAFPSFDDSPWPYLLAGTLAAGLAGL
ncbi:MAG: hypothetical protein M3131_01480, partial [Actinomycetota bacterium]|nr:hypothetical protein [Actinomycetota bacterium]